MDKMDKLAQQARGSSSESASYEANFTLFLRAEEVF
jgi:hypothetical protein